MSRTKVFNNILYFTLKDSLLSDEEKNEKLHVKNGVPVIV